MITNPKTERKTLTRYEAAEQLGVSEKTIDRMRADGQIKAKKIRGSVRIPQSEIDKFL